MPSSEKPLTPRKAMPKREALQVLERQRADHRSLDPPELAAEEDAVDAGHVGERAGHPQAVRQDGEAQAGRAVASAIARASASTVVPLSRNTESPSCSSSRHARAIASLPARFAPLRPANSRSIDGLQRERAAVRALEQARGPAAR